MLEGSIRILTVGAPSGAQITLADLLAARPAVHRRIAATAEAVPEVAGDLCPDLVIDWSGTVGAVRKALADAYGRREPPPLLAVVGSANADASAALAAGATEVLRAAASEAEAWARIEVLLALRRARQDLVRQATVDPLTGTLGRRTFLTRATEEVERARRYGHHLSLLLADIDVLKEINAAHGTDVGDTALRTLAATCSTVLRETDLLGRLGDDEMAVLLPSTTGSGALALAERLRAALAETPVTGADGTPFTMTVCIGAAEAGDDSVEVLIGRAEKAMTAAQRQGRNHLMLAIGRT